MLTTVWGSRSWLVVPAMDHGKLEGMPLHPTPRQCTGTSTLSYTHWPASP
jgi:hypothetical protein